jgi:hypothetical protein
MSYGPHPEKKLNLGVQPYGHAEIGIGKKVGASAIGIGVINNTPTYQAYAGVSQTRGGSNPFAGKPSTSVGIGFKLKF